MAKKTQTPLPPEEIADRIREVREARGLSRYRLSQLAGVNQGYLGEIEARKKSPSWEIVCKIADALDVTVADFRSR